jgi:hypothetical protein
MFIIKRGLVSVSCDCVICIPYIYIDVHCMFPGCRSGYRANVQLSMGESTEQTNVFNVCQ